MNYRRGLGAWVLAGLVALPALAPTGVALADTPGAATPPASVQIDGVPPSALPSVEEQQRIQTSIRTLAGTLVDGQRVLVDTFQGIPIYVQNASGQVRIQVGQDAPQTDGLGESNFSFCADVEVPAALAAIAALGGAAAIFSGGALFLPEYGIIITATQLSQASAAVSVASALYTLVKNQICG